MSIETFRLIIEAGATGVLVLVLVGVYLLIKNFAPQFLAAWTSLTTTLGKFGQQVESFGEKVDSLGVKVDAARDRSSEAATEAVEMRRSFDRSSSTGTFPAVTAAAGGQAPAAPPPRG